MNNVNLKDIVKLEGKSGEIDECLYQLFDKQASLKEISDYINGLNVKEMVRKISNFVLGVLGVGFIIAPNTLLVTFIIFCIFRLFMVKFVGFKTRSQRAFSYKMARMRKQFLEAEINDLIKNIEKLNVQCDCQEISMDKSNVKNFSDLDEVKENKYSYVWEPNTICSKGGIVSKNDDYLKRVRKNNMDK